MSKIFRNLALVAALSSVACGARLAPAAVQVDTSVVDALSQVKEAKDVRCDADEIPASSCKALATAFVPVWDAYLAANRALLAESSVEEVDAAIADFKAAAVEFRDVINQVPGAARDILLDLLEKAVRRFDR